MNCANRGVLTGAVVVGLLTLSSGWAVAGSHLWRINEVFSNSDGTIQFIELKEIAGAAGENFLGGYLLTAAGPPMHTFTFPAHLVGSTANRHLLLATSGFAALPGAPTPDYTIQDNFFRVTGGDTLRYHPSGNYDIFTFGPGALPLNGVNSIQLTAFAPPMDTFTTGPNSPTNYTMPPGSEGPTVVAPSCSNGVTEGVEQCDDANASNNDSCLNSCLNATCGDGFTRTGVEDCDDANASNNDACLNSCVDASCGDGFVRTGLEVCDTGGESATCDSDCTPAACGDGTPNAAAGEACDTGAESATCDADCSLATCGDGTWNTAAGEACDDGNDIDGDGCTACACDVPNIYGDLNGDGVVDINDILCVLEDFAHPANCADNGDIFPCSTRGGGGIIDLDDILSVLNAFGGDFACTLPCG